MKAQRFYLDAICGLGSESSLFTLRISQTVSSADAHVNDRVQFEVTEEARIADALIVPKAAIAWGTVTEARHKRRLGRGGKVEIVMNSVRLADERWNFSALWNRNVFAMDE